MRVRNKEHQSLSLNELQQLCDEFPNDQQLGEELRRLTKVAATVNNSKSQRVTSENQKNFPFINSFPTSI
jgi:hypothetical protein